MKKPAPEIYRHLLSRIDLPADSLLLIDDKPENVRGAKRAGMHGILFETEEGLIAELRRQDNYYSRLTMRKMHVRAGLTAENVHNSTVNDTCFSSPFSILID